MRQNQLPGGGVLMHANIGDPDDDSTMSRFRNALAALGAEPVGNEWAEDGGFVFVTTKTLSESSGGVTLTESHESKPQGIRAKIM